VLDLNCPLALGYNHDKLINLRDSDDYDRFLGGKTDLSTIPPHDYADMLREKVMPVAPNGMNQVFFADGSTTNANETALSTALMHYAMNHKRDYKNLSVLGFEKGSHGQSIATLSCSDREVNANKLPLYQWPIAPLPKFKYPFAEHEKANRAEEERCLKAAHDLIKS